jgi:hypothetical protein
MGISEYVNKTVPFKFNGAELKFDLSHALFSSFDIDRGTKLLLKAVAHDPVLARARNVLDEGCGVGVIGLSIAKAFPGTEVVMRDRDSLAVAFSEHNRHTNRIACARDPGQGSKGSVSAPSTARAVWACIGTRAPSDRYNFILSNLPAKAGAPVLASFFASLTGSDGRPPLLAEGGRAAVVIVEPLALKAESWIESAHLRIVGRERGAEHVVFVIEAIDAGGSGCAGRTEAQPDPEAFDLGPYRRGSADFRLAELRYRASGFWGLPEFDTPSFSNSAAAELAARTFPETCKGHMLVIDPGVGHFALWAARACGCRSVTAASRDLVSLAACAANLSELPQRFRPTYTSVDELGLDSVSEASFDVIADFSPLIPELDRSTYVWSRASRLLKPGGVFLAVRGLAEMARLERHRPSGSVMEGLSSAPLWTSLGKRRKKGAIAAAWRKSDASA